MIHVKEITRNGCFHFLESINFEDCWEYVGPAYWVKGYPIIRRFHKNWIASRFAWFIFTGRDYYKREVHHKCHNRACVNPTHLEELTAKRHRRYHNETRNTSETNRVSK